MCNIETIFVHKDQDVGAAAPVEYAFLTKGAVRAEVNLSNLSPEDREAFDKAIDNEWRR